MVIARNSLQSLAVTSDSESEVEQFIIQTQAALEAETRSKQLTISILSTGDLSIFLCQIVAQF